jgi:hypothetical protein
MRHIVRLAVAAGIAGTLLALLVSVLAVAGLVHLDHYRALHTYGVSIGSDTHYCSAELIRWHPSITCEASR